MHRCNKDSKQKQTLGRGELTRRSEATRRSSLKSPGLLRTAVALRRVSGLRLPYGIREQSPNTLLRAVRAAEGLDVGEAMALSLAVEIHADAILIDERRGHEVAIQLGLRTTGLLGCAS